jgi:HEAT repeat protein
MQELAKQLSDQNVDTRRNAVERIREIKGEACIPLLLKAMGDGSWRVRKSAVDVLLNEYPIEEYINGLIQLLYIDDNAGARNSAIEALIKLGKQATVYLIEAFQTSNKDVRKFVIDVLGEEIDNRSLPLMLDAIKDEDENVRVTAVEQLGKIGEPSVVDALILILEQGDLWTAFPAADALGRIGNRKAVPFLVSALSNKPLREPVLKALGLLSDPSSLPAIIPLMGEKSTSIQEQTLKTIEQFYHNGVNAEFIINEIKKVFGHEAVDLLISYAWSNKREVRISAILLLGLMKDEAAYSPLLDISHEEEFTEDVRNALVFIGKDKPESLLKLFANDNPHQRRFICEVADKIVSPVYYEILEKRMEDEDGHVRSIAARAISKLKDARIIEKLMGLLSDRYVDVQESAVDALSNLKEALDIDELLNMLKDRNAVLRKNTVSLLGKIGVERAVKELGFVLKDEDVKVRKAVVEALSLIGTEEAVRYLTYALTDETSDIRIASALSLGTIGGEDILDALIILTADPSNAVRVAATKALGMLKDRRAVKTLRSLLHDISGFVVTSALESLSMIGGDEARDAIVTMLESDDNEIKRTAIICLSSAEGVENRLIALLKDPDWATRMAAVKVLGKRPEGNVKRALEMLLDTEDDDTVQKAVEETLRV